MTGAAAAGMDRACLTFRARIRPTSGEARVRLLFHAVLILGFFVGGDILLNHGQGTRAINTEILHFSKNFQRQINRLVD
jgi:hypothetical protein